MYAPARARRDLIRWTPPQAAQEKSRPSNRFLEVLADPSIRNHVREAEQAARRLLERAAHLEKRAGRPRADPAERLSLTARARELREDAEVLLAEISELSRRTRLSES